MKQTSNYQLPQWEETDRIMMRDFNDMTAKLDKALATIPKILIGTYTGDGQETQTIDVGFKPKAVLVFNQHGRVSYYFGNSSYYAGGLAIESGPVVTEEHSGKTYNAIELTETGFIVRWKSISTPSYTHYVTTNKSAQEYRYIVIA